MNRARQQLRRKRSPGWWSRWSDSNQQPTVYKTGALRSPAFRARPQPALSWGFDSRCVMSERDRSPTLGSALGSLGSNVAPRMFARWGWSVGWSGWTARRRVDTRRDAAQAVAEQVAERPVDAERHTPVVGGGGRRPPADSDLLQAADIARRRARPAATRGDLLDTVPLAVVEEAVGASPCWWGRWACSARRQGALGCRSSPLRRGRHSAPLSGGSGAPATLPLPRRRQHDQPPWRGA